MLVSVVIPAYNRGRLLERSVRSVLDQTFRDFELIIVDDASSDNTGEIVRKLQAEDPRIRYIRHESNKGEAASRNTGIRAAQGEYIANHDSDDEWLPRKLEKQLEVFFISPPGVGVVYTGMNIGGGNEDVIYYPPCSVKKKEGDLGEVLIEGNFIGCPTTLVKKECFDECGLFDTGLRHLVDLEMWLRIARKYEFRIVDEPLVEVHVQPDSVSRDYRERLRASETILARHCAEFNRPGPLRAGRLRGLAQAAAENNDMLLARKYALSAFFAFPFRAKYLALSLFPGLAARGRSGDERLERTAPTLECSLCVVNWNSRDLLARCLDSIVENSRGLDCETIVVDNGSVDGSAEMVEHDFPVARLIRNADNLGYTRGNNQAISASRGRFVFLLNSDIAATPGSLDRLLEIMRSREDIGVLSCALRNPDGSAQHLCYRFPTLVSAFFEKTFLQRLFPGNRFLARYYMKDWDHRDFREVDQPPGCCLLARREVFERVGLLDERMFLFYSDVDFCLRVRKAGYRIFFTPEVVLGHGLNSSVKRLSTADDHWFRDKMTYFRKHHGEAAVMALKCVLAVDFIIRIAELAFYRLSGKARRGEISRFGALLARIMGS